MNRCVKRRYYCSSQCSNCSTKYFSSGAISIRNSKCGHGNKEKQKRSAVAYESFWTAAIFQRYRQRSCPFPLLSRVRIFFYLSFFFFFTFHVSTLLPFERRETSRTNSPHPSALNRRLIHVATMKEEKCFVLAINNNEIHPVDVPCERYYSVSPTAHPFSSHQVWFLSCFLWPDTTPATCSPLLLYRFRPAERDNGCWIPQWENLYA